MATVYTDLIPRGVADVARRRDASRVPEMCPESWQSFPRAGIDGCRNGVTARRTWLRRGAGADATGGEAAFAPITSGPIRASTTNRLTASRWQRRPGGASAAPETWSWPCTAYASACEGQATHAGAGGSGLGDCGTDVCPVPGRATPTTATAFSRPRTTEDELPVDVDGHVRFLDAALSTEEPAEEVEAEPRGAARLPLLGPAFRRDLDLKIKAELEALGRKHTEEQGRHLAGESRLLLRDLGVERLHLYAIPTTTGQVGFYLVGGEQPGVGGSVAAVLPEGITWRISYERTPGKPTHLIVFGLVANEVAAVEVKLKGETRPAILANNAFFYEAEGREPGEVGALILHDHAGNGRRLPIEG